MQSKEIGSGSLLLQKAEVSNQSVNGH